MTNPYTSLVSVFPDVIHTTVEERIELGAMLYRILDGTYTDLVNQARAVLNDKQAYSEQKKRLPAFTPAGLFSRRGNIYLEHSTNVVHFDYDGLASEAIPAIMDALRHDPYVLYAFRSPSYQGIKLGVWTSSFTDDATYKHAWHTCAQYLREGLPTYHLEEDAQCKDVARLCFVSADSQMYINPHPMPYLLPPYDPPAEKPPPLPLLDQQWDSLEVGRMLACIGEIDDRERWLTVGMALHSSGEPWARGLWESWSARSGKYVEADQDTAWRSFHADGKISMGTLVHLAQAGGWAPLRATLKPTKVLPSEPIGAQGWEEAAPSRDIPLTDLADMLERTYPTPRWLIKGLIPEGLTFLVGSPKSSKTYLAYSLALSLAYEAQRGGKWLEQYEVALPGPVIYISLEDDEADSRFRIAELAPWMSSIPRGQMLFVHGFDVPRFNEGLTEWLEQMCQQHRPSLIVIDPISYLYDAPKKGGDQFGEVKDMLLPLRWLGKTYHCAVLGVDHRRKKSAEDVDIFETTYGSNAKIAVADSLLMVVRDDHEVTVHARVRKGEDKTLSLSFEFASDGTARWLWKGASDGIINAGNYGELRVKVLEVLQTLKTPTGIGDLVAACEVTDTREIRKAIYQVLFRAQKAGEVEKTSKNKYVWVGGDGWMPS